MKTLESASAIVPGATIIVYNQRTGLHSSMQVGKVVVVHELKHSRYPSYDPYIECTYTFYSWRGELLEGFINLPGHTPVEMWTDQTG